MSDVKQLEYQVKELKSLLNAFKKLNSDIEINEVFQNILFQMLSVVKAEAGTLWVMNRETSIIEACAAQGPTSSAILTIKMQKGEGIVGKVVSSAEPHFIENVAEDPSWAKRVDQTSGFITRSMITVPLSVKGQVIGALQLLNKQGDTFFSEDDVSLAMSLANQSALALHNSQMYNDLYRMYLSMVRTLARVLDARDPYTAGHSERVAMYSSWIAERMGFDPKQCEDLYKAALLHDIGKIGISDAILRKPDRLTKEEYETIKKHPEIGAEILANMEPKDVMKDSVEIAKYHHERMDGSGYPDRLKGASIPLLARIVAVADAFDAMTTVRSYSNGLSYREAAEELVRCKERLFDGDAVDAFSAILKELDYEPCKKKQVINEEMNPFESI